MNTVGLFAHCRQWLLYHSIEKEEVFGEKKESSRYGSEREFGVEWQSCPDATEVPIILS